MPQNKKASDITFSTVQISLSGFYSSVSAFLVIEETCADIKSDKGD
jgi:hypothetical protein